MCHHGNQKMKSPKDDDFNSQMLSASLASSLFLRPCFLHGECPDVTGDSIWI